MKIATGGRIASAACSVLSVNQFVVDDLNRPIPYVVHASDPRHLVMLLELLGHAFLLRHLFYHPGEEGFYLLVDVGEIVVEFAGENKA